MSASQALIDDLEEEVVLKDKEGRNSGENKEGRTRGSKRRQSKEKWAARHVLILSGQSCE